VIYLYIPLPAIGNTHQVPSLCQGVYISAMVSKIRMHAGVRQPVPEMQFCDSVTSPLLRPAIIVSPAVAMGVLASGDKLFSESFLPQLTIIKKQLQVSF
jgi:hypothetical protein